MPPEMEELLTPSGSKGRVGTDELNLCEFPFALLNTKGSRNPPLALEFRDGNKEWTVTGDAKYGLPNYTDVQAYVVLMEYTREQGFPEAVEFSRYDACKRLGWSLCGESYDRFTLALDRLVGVTIRMKNSFYDLSQRKHVNKEAFHILERYKLTDIYEAGARQPSLFPSWIRWSPDLYRSLQLRHISWTLDVGLFLELRSAVSQALYRYLDAKRYDGKPTYRIGVRKLAFEHLGLSRNYVPSHIKRRLDPAHEELIRTGFLAGAEYAPMKTGEEMVVYQFAQPLPRSGLPKAALPVPSSSETFSQTLPALPAPLPSAAPTQSAFPFPEEPAPDEELVASLREAKLSQRDAQRLARERPEECRRQLEYLPYRDQQTPGGGLLFKAIVEGWAAPAKWETARKREKAATRTREQQQGRDTQVAQVQASRREFQAWWEGLSEEEREQIYAQARPLFRQENRTLAERLARNPKSPFAREALLDLIFQRLYPGRERPEQDQ